METAPIQIRILPLAAAFALAACAAGTQFIRPPPDAIQLGKTTYAQVVERFGKPSDETRFRKNDHLLRRITYAFSNDADATKVQNTVGMRQLSFVLSDDIVVGEGFVSSFASDNTDFDDRRVGEFVKGRTRCDEVVAILGRPSVRAAYPATDKEGETAIAYDFRYLKRPVLQFKTFRKGVTFLCDREGVVTEASYIEEGDR